MKYLKEHKVFNSEHNGFQRDLLSLFGYYVDNDEKKKEKALDVYKKHINTFKNTKINHSDEYYFKPDNSPKIVYHSSNNKFDIFKTPTFFSSNDSSYSGDYTYACIINLTNPLDISSRYFINKYGKDNGIIKWKNLLIDVMGEELYKQKEDYINNHQDFYGLFKILETKEGYNWDILFNYLKKNNYDGAIYRESDESIRNFFEGYIVMKAEDIKILHVVDNN